MRKHEIVDTIYSGTIQLDRDLCRCVNEEIDVVQESRGASPRVKVLPTLFSTLRLPFK